MKHNMAAASSYQASGCLGRYRRTPMTVATTEDRPSAAHSGDE